MKRWLFLIVAFVFAVNAIGVSPAGAAQPPHETDRNSLPLASVSASSSYAPANSGLSLALNTFLGGSGNDITSENWNANHGAIAVDGSGNIYIAGSSSATWGTPLVDYAHHGSDDAFVAKLDSSGSLVWHIFLGGTGSDYGNAIALDSSGNVYLAGTSSSAWSCSTPCTVRAYNWNDAYVAKISPAGALVWNSFMGGGDSEEGYGITVDSGGDIYLVGAGYIDWGCVVDCTAQHHPGGGTQEGYAAKIDPSGNLTWNTFLGNSGGSAYDVAHAVAVDSGNVYVGGYSTHEWGTPVRAHAGSGTYDSFLTKLDSSSGALTWNTFLGGTSRDWIYSIEADGSGNVYAAGRSEAAWSCSPVACTARPHSASSYDGFVSKVDSSGALTWNTFLGAGGLDEAYSVALDGSGNVLVSGVSPATWENPIRAHSGGNDAFAAQLNPSNGSPVWNTFLGGGGSDKGNAITAYSGKVYVTGISNATWGSPSRAYTSGNDVYVAILASSAKAITGFSIPGATSTTIDDVKHTVTVTVPEGTNRSSLTPTITHTGASVSPNSGVAQNFTSPVTYTVTAQDGSTQNYRVLIPSPEKSLTSFSFPETGDVGVITGTNIDVILHGNNEQLVASFTTTGKSVVIDYGPPPSSASGIVPFGIIQQISGMSANTFEGPVIYKVIAQDGTTKDYTVTLNSAVDSKDITEFYFTRPAAIGEISGTDITVRVPNGTNLQSTLLTPYFTTTGASVKLGVSASEPTVVSGEKSLSFNNPVPFTVVAQNGTTKTYAVTVIEATPDKDITAFGVVEGYSGASFIRFSKGVITGTDIAVTVPYGTDVSRLPVTYTHTGRNLTIIYPASGMSIQAQPCVPLISKTSCALPVTRADFTDLVIFRVTANDGSTKNYTVTVTVEAPVVVPVLPTGVVNVVYTDPATGDMYTGTTDGLFISTDGGSTFTDKTVENGLGSNNVLSVAVAAGKLYVGTDNGLSISADGGATFTTKTTSNGLGSNVVIGIQIDPNNSNKVFASTNGGLSTSTDGGNTFTTTVGLGSDIVNDVAVNSNDSNNVIVATDGGLSTSTNGGSSFSNKTTSNGLGTNKVNRVATTTQPTTQISGGPKSLAVVPGKLIIYAATDGGLSISLNGGNTFFNRTTADGLASNTITDVFVNGEVVYVTTPAGVSISVDGGNKFRTLTTANGLGSNQANSIFATGGSVYMATDAGLYMMPDVSKDITEFGFTNPAAYGLIDEDNGVIVVTVPASTNRTALVPVFTATGISVSVGDVPQENGVTANDFTYPVNYEVMAANGSSKFYTVVVSESVGVATACAVNTPTYLNSVDFNVSFSESVTGVDINDFKLTNTLLTGAYITGVTGSGMNYVVTVNTGSGSGTIRLDVPATATIQGLGRSFSAAYTGGKECVIYKGAAPTIPVLKTPASNALVANYSPILDWDDSSEVLALANAWSYEVNVIALGGYNYTFNTASGLTNSSLSDWSAAPLAPNTTYTWKVRACNATNQCSAWSLTRTFRTRLDMPILNSPADNEMLNNKRPVFEWDAVDGATSYTLQVFKKSTTGFFTVLVNTGTITPPAYIYTPAVDLLPNTEYQWQVRANGLNLGNYSARSTFTTSINPPKNPILSLPSTGYTIANTIDAALVWIAPLPVINTNATLAYPTAVSYDVQVSTNARFENISENNNTKLLNVAAVTTNLSTVLATGTSPDNIIRPGRTYYWRVRSISADGNHSAWSAVRTIKIKFVEPTLVVPANGATDISRTAPTFTWDSGDNGLWTNYTIQLATTPPTATSFSVVKSFTVLAPHQTYTAVLTTSTQLLSSKTYYWRVRINGLYIPIFSTPTGAGTWSFTTTP